MKDLTVCFLIDLYGKLLPPAHLERAQEYYNNDLSINEIANNNLLTRQAVYDSIVKSTSQLKSFEACLKLAQKLDILKQKLSIVDFKTVLDVVLQD